MDETVDWRPVADGRKARSHRLPFRFLGTPERGYANSVCDPLLATQSSLLLRVLSSPPSVDDDLIQFCPDFFQVGVRIPGVERANPIRVWAGSLDCGVERGLAHLAL